MAMSPEQLSSSLKHLKRTPAPKVPIIGSSQPRSPLGMGPINLNSIKLKKTGKRESLIEADVMADHGKDNSANELNSFFDKRRGMFDGNETSTKPATFPRVAPKPRRTSQKDGELSPKPRSGSFPRNNSITDGNGNLVQPSGTPTLKPLPTLQSIGSKPPSKPPKPQILTMKIERKYKNHKVIIAPKVQEVLEDDVQNGSFDQDSAVDSAFIEEEEDEEIYDDICNAETFIPEIPSNKIPVQIQEEPELFEEELYDDVEQLAETVKAELGQNAQGHGDDGLNLDNGSGEYGDDIYQPVEGSYLADKQIEGVEDLETDEEYQILPGEVQPTTPVPPLPSESTEDPKAKKERERKEKESMKKKEKDELKRKRDEERREKEDKKKKEEERRKREKTDKDLKKFHKLKGDEPVLSRGAAKNDISGNGKDLPCTKGSSLEVIVKDNNCPPGKWLVKDQQDHYGYVSSESLFLEVIPTEGASEDAENLDEDLYECVETFQSSSQPPPPPVSTLPPQTTDDTMEELYDDTLVEEDEDLYDDIPGANL